MNCTLPQAASSWHSGMAGGLVEGSFEIIFFAEFVFGLLLEPMKMVPWRGHGRPLGHSI
jgi:hypothetical protein